MRSSLAPARASRTARARLGAGLLLILTLAVAPAATAQSSFYDSYELGLRAEKEGRFQDALEHMQKAASQRAAAGRRVKTYGLNFLDVYDPYLHMSRASLELGKLDEAASYLETSRKQGVSPVSEYSALEEDLARRKAKKSAPVATVPPTPPQARPTAGPLAREPSPTLRVEPSPTEVRPLATSPPARPTLDMRIERPAPAAVTAVSTPPPATPFAPALTPGAPPPVATAMPAVSAVPSRPAPESDRESVSVGLLGIAVCLLLAVAAALVVLLRRSTRREAQGRATSAEPPRAQTARERLRTLSRTTPLFTGGSPSPYDTLANAGTPFGGYLLEKVLGQGGMGTTFLARRTRDSFPVVVKVPHDHLLTKPEFVNRFLLEGSLGATLHHPGIIRIYEAGEVEGYPFIAMELVEGASLEKTLENGQRLPLRRALDITRDIALALDYAHMKGVVHRDLKPDNIMILETGHAKVMDYGIARILGSEGLTATGIYVGTPVYSAPESLSPSDVDTQSDLYSLGIILFRMLSGRLPFTSANPLEILQKHALEPLPVFPEDLAIPTEVRLLVERLTAKNKADRYATAELFLRELDAFLNRAADH